MQTLLPRFKLPPLGQEPPIRYYTRGDLLRIERPWYTPLHLAFFVFSLLWNAVGFFFFAYFNNPLVPKFVLALPALSLFFGGGMTYFSLAGLLNQTIVRLNSRGVLLKHRPLLCRASSRYLVAELNQFFVVEKSLGRWAWPYDKLYDLMVLQEDGHCERFMGNFTTAAAAREVERSIEDFLRIRNRPMEGEFQGQQAGT